MLSFLRSVLPSKDSEEEPKLDQLLQEVLVLLHDRHWKFEAPLPPKDQTVKLLSRLIKHKDFTPEALHREGGLVRDSKEKGVKHPLYAPWILRTIRSLPDEYQCEILGLSNGRFNFFYIFLLYFAEPLFEVDKYCIFRDINQPEIKALVKALKKNSFLKTLDVSVDADKDNVTGQDTAILFKAAAESSTLETFEYRGNIDLIQLDAFFNNITKTSKVHTLHFSYCNIGPKAIDLLAQYLKFNDTLQKLIINTFDIFAIDQEALIELKASVREKKKEFTFNIFVSRKLSETITSSSKQSISLLNPFESASAPDPDNRVELDVINAVRIEQLEQFEIETPSPSKGGYLPKNS